MANDLIKTSRVPEPTTFPEGPEKDYFQQVVRVLRNNFQNLENLIDKAMSLIASNVTYDNTTSGLTATNVQDALDEIVDITGVVPSADIVTYDNTTSGLTATNVQDALDEIDSLVDDISTDLSAFGSPSDYATAAQGAKADTALQPNTQLVRQITQVVDTTNRSTSSTSYVTSNVAATLPSNLATTSSKVRVQASGLVGLSSGSGVGFFTVLRNSTDLTPSGNNSIISVANGVGGGVAIPFSIDFIDSPASVTPATYTIHFKTNTGIVYLGRRHDDTAIDVPTTITLTEITA